jgi:hypothetical protein
MNTSITPARLEQLRRDAKRVSRLAKIPLHQAQAQIATELGFKNWSLLAKQGKTQKQMGSTQGHMPLATAPLLAETPTSTRPSDPRKRYYLHGDQSEDDSTRYYCASCDVFFHAEHFNSEHGQHTGERFLESLARWEKRDGMSKANWRRPDDSVNVLKGSALAARVEYQTLRAEFSDWLFARRNGRDAVSFMAAEVLTRRGLPTTPKSVEQLRRHYARRGFNHRTLDAFYTAWDDFKASR